MAIHQENERHITAGMTAGFAGSGNDVIDFVCGEIFPRSAFGIGRLLGWPLDRK
jgi:hypothetical protein